jgi:transmembrane sensor
MIRLIHNAPIIRKPNLDEEALSWVSRLTSGSTTPEDHESFRKWRDQSEEHRAALVRARTLWTQLGTALPAIDEKKKRSGRTYRGAMRALPIAASMLLGLHLGWQYWTVGRFDHVTAVGERREIALADGSRIMLSGDTAVDIDFRHGTRRIDIARGEALFNVRHDPSTPFVVHAAGGEMRDVGTVFDVALQHEGVRVVVSQGIVEASSDDRRLILRANQATSLSSSGPGQVQNVDAQSATAWTRGRLILNDMSLTEILAAIQPYHRGRIILMDQEAGRQPLSAVIDLDHIDDWLDALAKRNSVRITRIAGVTILT